jgi:hypothetical protein
MPEYIQPTKYGPGPRIIPKLDINQSPTVGLASPWMPGYDNNLRPEYNQEWHRSSNQP